ncbi:MAG: glycosyltransferase family 2 protein [Hyphomicrobiales bacterium]
MSPADERIPPPEAPDAPPAVTAIVVSYNSARDLPACLRSLEAQEGLALRIRLVDNASRDGSAALARREFPGVVLTENAENVGFGRAVNQVLETEPAAFYALVNPDTILPPRAVATCVAALRADESVGVAATRLVGADGATQPSCQAFLGLRNLFAETLGLHRLLPSIRSLASLQMTWFAYDRALDVDWIQGAFLVVRGSIVRTVGGFDPAFFMYGEEMDWCRRIRDAGHRIRFLPEPPVVHVGAASTAPIAEPMFVENLKGRIRYLRKHHGPRVALAGRGLIAVAVLLRFAWREAAALTAPAPRRSAARTERAMFRAALAWVLRGLPLTPPEIGARSSPPT